MEEPTFAEAERLFDNIMSGIEAHLEKVSPGMSGLQYHFVDMGGLREHRRIVVNFRDAHGGEVAAEIYMPGASHWLPGVHDMTLDLTGQEYETFLDLVYLGGCLDIWPVDGLLSPKGSTTYAARGFVGISVNAAGAPIPIYSKPMISPLAILAAFAGGEFEAEWPNRKKHFENAWFIWQARNAAQSSYYEAQVREQGGGKGADIWKSDEGPDYL